MQNAPPTIFSRSRRLAARRRSARLQREADPARFVIDDIAEDMLERLAFLRHEPRRALVIGDWTGELAASLRAGMSPMWLQGRGEPGRQGFG